MRGCIGLWPGTSKGATCPGLVRLISRRGEVHVDAIGTKALGGSDAMRRDTIFRIASLSKPSRRGPLDETVPASRPIALRDLLTLQMGIGHLMTRSAGWPIQEALNEYQLLQGPPRPQQPGEKWMYDLGLDVLGVLLARAAGQPLETFLNERVFGPLGMKDTGFSVPPEHIDRLATSYYFHPETEALEVYDVARDGGSRPPAFPSACGGLVSTIDDYWAFGQMMLNGGKLGSERILSRALVETMTSDQLTPAQKAISGLVPGYFESHGWGFGVAVVTRRYDIAASPNPPAVCRDFWTSAYQAIED